MNYSSFPNENQSGIPKIDLLYSEKKNNRVKPYMSHLKKKNNTTRKVSFTPKDLEKSIEHFSNPSSKKKKSSNKEDSKTQKDVENEKTTYENLSSDLDSTDDDNDTPNEEVSSGVEKKPRSFLSRIISGILTIVFFVLIGAVIYIGYMYFIKKKNIFASEEIITSETSPTENILDSSEALKLPVEENISSIPIVDKNTNITPLINNDSLKVKNEMIGKDTEMTGGQNEMVSDIINILKKFQN